MIPSLRGPILVTGATGKQGAAVVDALLSLGFMVRALVRNPASPAARALSSKRVELSQGDLDDDASCAAALEGAAGVFSVQSFDEQDFDRELRQGVRLAKLAKAARVGHFVYSSVGSAHLQTGIPHFDSKYKVEQAIFELGLPYTILRPVFFMENWEWMRESITQGFLPQPLRQQTKLQQIAVSDIGRIAALAFQNPKHWIGRSVDIAGDELTLAEIAQTFERVTGHPVHYQLLPWEAFESRMGREMFIMFRWLDEFGYSASLPKLQAEIPELLKLEGYLHAANWGHMEGTK